MWSGCCGWRSRCVPGCPPSPPSLEVMGAAAAGAAGSRSLQTHPIPVICHDRKIYIFLKIQWENGTFILKIPHWEISHRAHSLSTLKWVRAFAIFSDVHFCQRSCLLSGILCMIWDQRGSIPHTETLAFQFCLGEIIAKKQAKKKHLQIFPFQDYYTDMRKRES